MCKVNKFLLSGLCIILVASFVIPFNSQIAQAQFTEEEEISADEIAEEIDRLYKDYLRLKAEIDKKEEKLDEPLKLARQCILIKFGASEIEAQIARLEARLKQLEADLVAIDISKLKEEIKKLKALIPKLESAVGNYNRIKNDIGQLKNEINKLKQKVALLNKLLDLKQQKAKETDAYKIIDLDDEIKRVIEDINRLLGGLRPAAPPTRFEISGNFFYSKVDMEKANDNISWMNLVYDGDIDKIIEGTGFSGAVLYQLNSMIGLGLSYEYLSVNGQGESINPSPPPLTFEDSQTFSTSGLLINIAITIPEEIENFDIRGILGIGLYLSTYEYNGNYSVQIGHGSSYGGKAGMSYNYMFGNNFGVCGNVFYRTAVVDLFTDSNGLPILFSNGELAGANFSGFGVETGVLFRI